MKKELTCQHDAEEKEDRCSECGASAYCVHNRQDLCPECAVNEFFEALQVFVDPMREGFDVKYDIVVMQDALDLVGFSASWEKDTAEGYYDCIGLDALRTIQKEMSK